MTAGVTADPTVAVLNTMFLLISFTLINKGPRKAQSHSQQCRCLNKECE